ncbi:unnamed protein product, partial [Lepidochelys olivacea]
ARLDKQIRVIINTTDACLKAPVSIRRRGIVRSPRQRVNLRLKVMTGNALKAKEYFQLITKGIGSEMGMEVMSCSSLYYPECGVARPSPVSGSFNEPCVRQCPDSEIVIRPSPVVVTIPGPILSNFPQQSEVAAVGAPVVGAGYGGSF